MKKHKDNVDLQQDRYGLFVTQNSIDLDIMYGRNFLDTDNHQEITLHRINILDTKSHDLYGQTKAKDKKFFPPVRLTIMVNVEASKQEFYGGNQGGIVRDDTGNLVVGIYLKELEEKNVEINRGDIVEYNMSGTKNRYYEVENANNVTDETEKSIGGFITYWKRVVSVPIKEDVVPFLHETKGN